MPRGTNLQAAFSRTKVDFVEVSPTTLRARDPNDLWGDGKAEWRLAACSARASNACYD